MFYGYHMGMARQDILNEVFGSFIDLISCLAVFNGNAVQKDRKNWSFEEAIELR